MKKMILSVVAAAVLVPNAAFAAELGAPNQGAPTVVFESYDAATRVMVLRSGLIEPYSYFGCKLPAGIAVPATITKGRAVYVQYDGPGLGTPGGPPNNNNNCTQVSFN